MNNNQYKIEQLLQKLDVLYNRQQSFNSEIQELRQEILKLKITNEEVTPKKEVFTPPVVEEKPIKQEEALSPPPVKTPTPEATHTPKQKSDIEKFIGENLINKIGIAITVLGVAIGAKYAIDNELISPLTRIILGYVFGVSLLGVAIKLKAKYDNLALYF